MARGYQAVTHVNKDNAIFMKSADFGQKLQNIGMNNSSWACDFGENMT